MTDLQEQLGVSSEQDKKVPTLAERLQNGKGLPAYDRFMEFFAICRKEGDPDKVLEELDNNMGYITNFRPSDPQAVSRDYGEEQHRLAGIMEPEMRKIRTAMEADLLLRSIATTNGEIIKSHPEKVRYSEGSSFKSDKIISVFDSSYMDTSEYVLGWRGSDKKYREISIRNADEVAKVNSSDDYELWTWLLERELSMIQRGLEVEDENVREYFKLKYEQALGVKQHVTETYLKDREEKKRVAAEQAQQALELHQKEEYTRRIVPKVEKALTGIRCPVCGNNYYDGDKKICSDFQPIEGQNALSSGGHRNLKGYEGFKRLLPERYLTPLVVARNERDEVIAGIGVAPRDSTIVIARTRYDGLDLNDPWVSRNPFSQVWIEGMDGEKAQFLEALPEGTIGTTLQSGSFEKYPFLDKENDRLFKVPISDNPPKWVFYTRSDEEAYIPFLLMGKIISADNPEQLTQNLKAQLVEQHNNRKIVA